MTTTTEIPQKPRLALQAVANEFGQVTGLDAGATYFVVRKPDRALTQEKTREFMDDFRAFLHEHKVLSEQQVKEINARYAEPAMAKARDFRETMEKRFDELTREFEARVERIEAELGERAERIFKAARGPSPGGAPASGAPVTETPGEMPRGEGEPEPAPAVTLEGEPTPADAAQDELDRQDVKSRKKTGKK